MNLTKWFANVEIAAGKIDLPGNCPPSEKHLQILHRLFADAEKGSRAGRSLEIACAKHSSSPQTRTQHHHALSPNAACNFKSNQKNTPNERKNAEKIKLFYADCITLLAIIEYNYIKKDCPFHGWFNFFHQKLVCLLSQSVYDDTWQIF